MIRFKEKDFRSICCGIILFGTLAGCSNYSGEQLFHTEGCITCHRFKGTGGSMGPDLTAITQVKSDNWIHSYLKNPKKFNQQQVYGWRLAASEFSTSGAAAAGSSGRPRRARCADAGDPMTDDEA